MRIVHSLEELLDLPSDEHVNGFRRRESLQLDATAYRVVHGEATPPRESCFSR